MRDSWLKLVERVLTPARPDLTRCQHQLQQHLEARRPAAELHDSALAACRSRIEAARAEVFAADDGVVNLHMTELEREWRQLERVDAERSAIELWAKIAPRAWLDRKRYAEAEPALQLDVAVALASDIDGVEAAESAVAELVELLSGWQIAIGARVRFRSFQRDFGGTEALLAKPLAVALEALATFDGRPTVLERAEQLEQQVAEAALARFPARPALARALAHAAYVNCVWSAPTSATAMGPSPVAPLCKLWQTGYVLAAADERGVTLELPPL